MGYYTPSTEDFLVPPNPLEFVEISSQITEHKWKPTGVSGSYLLGGNPVTGKANDSDGGATEYYVLAKNLNTLSDVVLTSEDKSGVSLTTCNNDQASFYGDRDPYINDPNIFEVPTTSLGNEWSDRQYGGTVSFIPPDMDSVSGKTDITLKDNDGNTFIAKNAMEIASVPIVDPSIEGSVSEAVIKNNSIIEITGENLYYADFVDDGSVLEAVFHSSPIDYCAKIHFELQSGIRLDNKNWKMVFKTLPVDPNILTGIKRGDNKLIYLLNNGVKIIQISGNYRYLHEPEISGYSPKTASWGDQVLMSGSEFYGITGLKLGNQEIENFVVSPDTGITFEVPLEAESNHIHVFGSGGSISTEEELGRYGTEEISYNVCTHDHGSCERTGIGVDEFDNYYAAAYTLDASDERGTYGTPIAPYNVGLKTGHYKLNFSARKGRVVNILYSGFGVTGTAHPTGKQILEGRGCSWMWTVLKNASNYMTGESVYDLGEVSKWDNSGELKFGHGAITGDVLASGHANGFGRLVGDTGIVDFRDMSYNPAGSWAQVWGSDTSNPDYLPYSVYLTGISTGDTLSLWIRGHASSPEDYQKTQLNSATGVTGLDLRLTEKITYENYLAQASTFEMAPICPLPPELTLGNTGVQWMAGSTIPNPVYISCLNWNHIYSGDHYDHLKYNLGELTVVEPDIEVVDVQPRTGNYEDAFTISGKSLHNVSEIAFSGENNTRVTLYRSYDISGLSDFSVTDTSGINFNFPREVKTDKKFTIIQKSGLNDLQFHTSPYPISILHTGLVSMGEMSGIHNEVITVSGTHLSDVDFYFVGYTPSGETKNYIKSSNTTLISGTGAYVTVPKEIVHDYIHISGTGFFEETKQFFVPIPTISGSDKQKYYVGEPFELTGVNATEIISLLPISGTSKQNQEISLEFFANSEYLKLYTEEANIGVRAYGDEEALGSYTPISDVRYISDLGFSFDSLTGNYPESIKTGNLIITGFINPSFLGTGEIFLLTNQGFNSFGGTTIDTYKDQISSGIKDSNISKHLTIEISGKEPIISGIYPAHGGVGITPITVTGANFLNVTGVKFEEIGGGGTCVIPKSGFLSGIKFSDLYNDPMHNQVHLIDFRPCDFGGENASITLMDYEYNN